MSTTIKLRRGASTAFSTNNPTLQAGEPAFETDTGKLKIGDGTTAYNSLAYIGDGLKNNSTATDSLVILGSGTGTRNTVIGSGSSASTQSENTIIGANSNVSSSGGNILVGYNNSTNTQNITLIGNSTNVTSSSNSVRIGNGGGMSGSNQGVSIGYGARCVSASHGVAVGYNAEARSSNAIQLGQGTNNSASTLQFLSYQLVDYFGKIPNDRLNIDSAPTAASTNTVSSDGVNTALSGKADVATTLSGYGITDGADIDLSNVTDNATVLMSGMGMPSDKYIDLTLGASGSSYTAPANGWLTLVFDNPGTSGASGEGTAALINRTCKIGTRSSASYNPTQVFLPVFKGDEIEVNYNNTGTLIRFRFIYAVGSESEYTPASNS